MKVAMPVQVYAASLFKKTSTMMNKAAAMQPSPIIMAAIKKPLVSFECCNVPTTCEYTHTHTISSSVHAIQCL